MKKMIAVLACLIVNVVRAQSLQIVYPSGGGTITLGTNFTINVVVHSPTATNLMIALDYGIPNYEYREMTLLVTTVPAGLSTNVCILPNYGFDYPDQEFFITAYTGNDGISFSYATQSDWFDIDAPPVPNVTATSADQVMRPDQTNYISFEWTNVLAGQPYQVFLDWNDATMVAANGYDVIVPGNAPSKILIASGVLPTQNGSTNISIGLSNNIQPGQYGVYVVDSADASDSYDINIGGPNDTAYTYVGTTNVPTVAKMDHMYVIKSPTMPDLWGQITLLMEGIPNVAYYVDTSTDLVHWTRYAEGTEVAGSPSGSFYFRDNFDGKGNTFFYRLEQVP